MDADTRTALHCPRFVQKTVERRTCDTCKKQSRETHCSHRALGEDHSRPVGSARRVSRSSCHRHPSEAWQGIQPRENHPRMIEAAFQSNVDLSQADSIGSLVELLTGSPMKNRKTR